MNTLDSKHGAMDHVEKGIALGSEQSKVNKIYSNLENSRRRTGFFGVCFLLTIHHGVGHMAYWRYKCKV